MAKDFAIQSGTTTFSEIYQRFGDGNKEGSGMRFDGNVLYTRGKFQLQSSSQEAVESRAQKKQEAVKVIKDALTTEFGSDFAIKVMIRLQKDRGLDLQGGVITRGQLQDIRGVVNEMQQNLMEPAGKESFRKGDALILKDTIAEFHSESPTLRSMVGEHLTPDKVRSLLQGSPGPGDLQDSLERDLISRWKPENTEGMTAKQIKDETRKLEAQAKRVVSEALSEIYDELGINPAGNGFVLNEKGLARMERMLDTGFLAQLTHAEVTKLAEVHSDPVALKQHLDDHPELAFKLLVTPRDQMEQMFELGVNNPDFDTQTCLVDLARVGGLLLDREGFSCDSERLSEILQSTQGKPGVQPDFAYRVEVELLKPEKGITKIGGKELSEAAQDVYKKDTTSTQKPPPHLAVLTRGEMARVGEMLHDPNGLKTMFENDRSLMIKVATTMPQELKSHLSLLTDRGGLSVDDAYQRLLTALPGSDAIKSPDGLIDTVTVKGASYKLNTANFGDSAGFGEIFLMDRQGEKEGTEPRIILKKIKSGKENDPEAWAMMSNEIRLHANLSDKTDDVVKFLDPVRIGDDLYMAMEFCEGGSLLDPIFYDGVGQLGKQTGMDESVLLALKLSYMEGMLSPMSFIGEIEKMVHHDNKPGNYFMRGDGTLVMADFGTSSSGATSGNYGNVDNPLQHCPESVSFKGQGAPYKGVDHKHDCFAYGTVLAKFILGKDHAGFTTFMDPIEKALEALYDNRDGFHMPPEPERPDPMLGKPKVQYEKDKAYYDKMVAQKEVLEEAGFIIGDDGTISYFEDDGNPLKQLANSLLVGDPEGRASAAEAQLSNVMQALNNPELKQALKEMRALISQIDVTKVEGKNEIGNGIKTQTYNMTPQQKQRLDELTTQVSELIAADTSGIWQAMSL